MIIVLFLVSHFNFLFVPCGGLSWLPVSFLLHVKYTLSYRIVSRSRDRQTARYSFRSPAFVTLLSITIAASSRNLENRRELDLSGIKPRGSTVQWGAGQGLLRTTALGIIRNGRMMLWRRICHPKVLISTRYLLTLGKLFTHSHVTKVI